MQLTHYSTQPEPFEIIPAENGQALVRIRPSIQASHRTAESGEPETEYLAEEYTLTLPDSSRLADKIKANWSLYCALAQRNDREKMAALVREQRDKLLRQSDASVALDRLGLSIPESVSTSTMLSAVKAVFTVMREATTGPWAQYRQALRDIPQQPGFPYEVEFPEPPTTGAAGTEE